MNFQPANVERKVWINQPAHHQNRDSRRPRPEMVPKHCRWICTFWTLPPQNQDVLFWKYWKLWNLYSGIKQMHSKTTNMSAKGKRQHQPSWPNVGGTRNPASNPHSLEWRPRRWIHQTHQKSQWKNDRHPYWQWSHQLLYQPQSGERLTSKQEPTRHSSTLWK